MLKKTRFMKMLKKGKLIILEIKKYFFKTKYNKKPNRDYIINLWLKYHNTNVKEVTEKHTLEVLNSPSWFNLYKVTQEQYDEWEFNTKKYLSKYMNEYLLEKSWGWIVLDSAPSIKK